MKWSTVYDAYAKLIAKGEKLPNLTEGGYDKDLVKSTPFSATAPMTPPGAPLSQRSRT